MAWGIPCLAVVLIVTLSTASAFAVPGFFQKFQPKDTASTLHELFRLTRDTDVVSSSSDHGEAEDEGCTPLYQCWSNSGISTLLRKIVSFDFVDLTEALLTRCSGINVSSCSVDNCPDMNYRKIFQAGTTIVAWACFHQQDFVNSMGCWASPFEEQLTDCVRSGPESPRARLPHMRQCFVSTIRGLNETCTIHDQEFFLEFSSFVLDVQERSFPV